jgi:hypothetical protein
MAELKDGAGPAVEQQDGNRGPVRGEQGKEMDVIGFRVVIGNGDLVLRKRVDSGFSLSPIQPQSKRLGNRGRY